MGIRAFFTGHSDKAHTAPPEHSTRNDEADPLRAQVVSALKTVYDPEIPVDIWELGLVYALELDPAARRARIEMTLTAPGCPVAGELPGWVENAVLSTGDFDDVEVELVWDPPWNQEMMSARARLELNLL